MPKNNIYLPKENIPKTEEVREMGNKYEVPSFEEFMKTYESDDNLNYDDLRSGDIGEAKRYGPMPKLYRDVATFAINFSSEVNHWLYRGLFQYEDGTIRDSLYVKGIDEMKETLRKLENGTIKVVRKKQYESFVYEKCLTRESEVKEKLRKRIEWLENNWDYEDKYKGVCWMEESTQIWQH